MRWRCSTSTSGAATPRGRRRSSNTSRASPATWIRPPKGYHGQRPAAHGDLPAGERRGHLVQRPFSPAHREQEHLFDTKITAAVPDFSSRWLMEGKPSAHRGVRIEERPSGLPPPVVDHRGQGGRGRPPPYWLGVTELRRHAGHTTPPARWCPSSPWTTMRLIKGHRFRPLAMRSGIWAGDLAQWVPPAQACCASTAGPLPVYLL